MNDTNTPNVNIEGNVMGFRFQKRIKIVPGVTLNLSRKGVSTSFGTTGARVTLGHGQTRTTVGIPGSGISHTDITPNKKYSAGAGGKPVISDDTKNLIIGIGFVAALFAIAGLISRCTG